MLQEDQSRKKYVSDLTDAQWTLVAPLLPPAKSSPRGGRPRPVDLREVLNTIRYLHRSGCQWDMLPHDLLPKSTVYDYFSPWRDDGTWTKVVTTLREQTRVAAGREPRRVRSASIVNRSKRPRLAARSAAMTGARNSRAVSAIASWTRWGSLSRSSSRALVSMMAGRLCRSLH